MNLINFPEIKLHQIIKIGISMLQIGQIIILKQHLILSNLIPNLNKIMKILSKFSNKFRNNHLNLTKM